MTDNEIIKALEIHGNMKFDNCEGCPYLEGDSCEGFTKYSQPFREVLDLINRKTADIDFYKERSNKYEAQVEVLKEQTHQQKAEIDILIRKKETLRDEIAEQQAEIERLKAENQSIKYCYEQAKSYNNTLAESCEKNCKKFNMTTRADAIKEFAERLKKKAGIFPYHYKGLVKAVRVEKIDNLVKEMTGETVALKGSKSTGLEKFWQKIKKYCKKNICFFTPEDESELIQYGEKLMKEMVGDNNV